MQEKVKKWRNLGLIVADVYALWGWFSDQCLALGTLKLQSPEYAALAALFSGLLLMPFWENRPSVRFSNLATELGEARSRPFGDAKRRYWSERLGALKIETPPLDALGDDWKNFLSVLYPQALDRRIYRARRAWRKLEGGS